MKNKKYLNKYFYFVPCQKAIKIISVADESIMNKIYFIRKQKVMIDRDLAELYAVETKVLKQSVRRNIDRFPIDFMFEMSAKEFENWRSQNVTSNLQDKMRAALCSVLFYRTRCYHVIVHIEQRQGNSGKHTDR